MGALGNPAEKYRKTNSRQKCRQRKRKWLFQNKNRRILAGFGKERARVSQNGLFCEKGQKAGKASGLMIHDHGQSM